MQSDRSMLASQLDFNLKLMERIKDSAQKSKHSSLIDALQYTLKQFFHHFENDLETYNTERATQVLNHCDMFVPYFEKHLKNKQLDIEGQNVSHYLYACAKLAEMQLQSTAVFKAILDFEIIKLRALEDYFLFVAQQSARALAEANRLNQDDDSALSEDLSSSVVVYIGDEEDNSTSYSVDTERKATEDEYFFDSEDAVEEQDCFKPIGIFCYPKSPTLFNSRSPELEDSVELTNSLSH